ncbi:hypothetical protein NHX12_031517 [Muraenolepis orangiensis]|uniref:Uncharacterized protein n=1 Tax=Muraenolepis orangiensis TaxID=630683 RepID=A0A9Q0IKN5_9TELE|nr:hypothetical protein NHX12_031517 [Muraenolepis orangiensis]
MTCKLNGLFSIGEDFDAEDLLEAEWAAPLAAPASLSAPLSTSAKLPSPATVSQAFPDVATHTIPPAGQRSQKKAPEVQDEFDDWDVDLADLDESHPQEGPSVHNQQTLNPPTVSPAGTAGPLISSVHGLRPSNRGRTAPETRAPYRASGSASTSIPPSPRIPPPPVRPATPGPRPSLVPASPRSPAVFPVPGPSPRPPRSSHPPTPQRPWTIPGAPPRGRSLFEPGSPAAYSPRPLSAPVLTNHLVQLVSAANNPPRKRPRSGARTPNTRRFPGPAGLLPQQPLNQSLDDIVVSVPQTPAHGAVARLPSQCSSSQSEEEEFSSSGPWGAMKADMGLDERNPACFLHSYSVVMVLRKAALRQLAQNKVPNMAVQLKSILHTHADAKAVFRDPTGEHAVLFFPFTGMRMRDVKIPTSEPTVMEMEFH